jgi:hypothetical protein
MEENDEFAHLAEQAAAFADSDEVARLAEQIDAYSSSEQLEWLAKQVAPFIAAARRVAARAEGQAAAEAGRSAVDAVRQQLPVMLRGAASLTATASLTVGGSVRGAASLTATATLTAGGQVHVRDADVAYAAETVTEMSRRLRRAGLAGLTPGELHNVVLAWLIALVFVVKVAGDAKMSGQSVIDSMLTNAPAWGGLALIITWRIVDKHR